MTLSDLLKTDAYYCYLDYVNIKLHFKNDKFTWYRNCNNAKLSIESFYKRKDAKLFVMCADKYKERRMWQDVFITMMLLKRDIYIHDAIAMPSDLMEYHNLRVDTVKNLKSVFREDTKKIKSYIFLHNMGMVEYMKPKEQSPIILTSAGASGISLETICLLDKVFQFSSIGNNSPLWDRQRQRIKKYSLLLDFEMQTILKSIETILSTD